MIALLVTRDQQLSFFTESENRTLVEEELKEAGEIKMQKLNRSSFRTLGIELSRRSKQRDRYILSTVKNPPTKTKVEDGQKEI